VLITDPTAAAMRAADVRHPGVLATGPTYDLGLLDASWRYDGLQPVSPPAPVRDRLNAAIYDKILRGDTAGTRPILDEAIEALRSAGADALVLACTDLSPLVTGAPLPMFDVTALHARAVALASLRHPASERRPAQAAS